MYYTWQKELKANGSFLHPAVGAQKDQWLIPTPGDLAVTLEDECNVDRLGRGLDLFITAGNRKEVAMVL